MSSNDSLTPHEVQVIDNVEREVQEIRRIDLLFEGIDDVDSMSNTSEEEDCIRSVPVHGIDDSEVESCMSEDSGSE